MLLLGNLFPQTLKQTPVILRSSSCTISQWGSPWLVYLKSTLLTFYPLPGLLMECLATWYCALYWFICLSLVPTLDYKLHSNKGFVSMLWNEETFSGTIFSTELQCGKSKSNKQAGWLALIKPTSFSSWGRAESMLLSLPCSCGWSCDKLGCEQKCRHHSWAWSVNRPVHEATIISECLGQLWVTPVKSG